ncbi:vitellogenin-3-like [Haematobia irritans]|uniref:Putative vitellogenin-1 n=1 Tax=Haematobia irritans TaxID=7368 RepID=A0A1L8EEQ3_HAEIR
MNPLGVLCVVACLAAAAVASPIQQYSGDHSNSLKPSQWLKPRELEQTPALDELTFEQLDNMPLEKGAKLMRKLYHLSQIDQSVTPDFVPSPANVPVYVFKPNGQMEKTTLNNYVQVVKRMERFGDEEVTIFISGLPESLNSVKKANTKLVEAYVQRNSQKAQPEGDDESSNWDSEKPAGGHLIFIDLGDAITDLERYATLDVHTCGKMIAKTLIELTNECDVPLDIIHVIGQGIGANVAGVSGKAFYGITGHKLRRITALDPASTMAKDPKKLGGLARGSADFVDAIHTSALGMGTTRRVGNIDFFPNGPCDGVPGSRSVIDAVTRATRFFAESVRPGNQRNFPAVESNSLKQYRNNDGYGKRTYMGIAAARDITGDYMLEVNEQSPFGKRSPAHKQNSYHGVHQTSYLQNDSY